MLTHRSRARGLLQSLQHVCFGSEADRCGALFDVCYGPIADIESAFADDMVAGCTVSGDRAISQKAVAGGSRLDKE